MRRGAAALGVAGVVLSGCGDDDSGSEGSITITDAWARPTPAGATLGAVYFSAESDGEDLLVGATVDPAVAGGAQMHMSMAPGDATMVGGTTVTDPASGGEVSMHEVPAIVLPDGEPVVLEPGLFHLMLTDLADPLETGETFDVTLEFEQGGEQVATVEVRDEAP